LIRALLNPSLYSHPVAEVSLRQTQMSFLLFAGDYVYKIKKPVDLGYLDYTTLERRRFFCHQEVKLNRRLCPGVYLRVVPISWRLGRVRLGGGGKVMEYAVMMRRLPEEGMMEYLLPRGGVTPRMVEQVAEKLAAFHKKAATSPEIATFGDPAAVSFNWQENFSQTESYRGRTVTFERYERIKAYVDDFLRRERRLLERRVEEGKVRDCHGDLHAAHICFGEDIYIYDCIEFNNRFRYCDVASEVAFLAMDLDFHYQPGLAGHFVESYTELSGDAELPLLMPFYKCYRAYVRGKVEGFKLDDPYLTEEEKRQAMCRARRYFNLACSYVPGGERARLIIVSGLPGTGKTALAGELSRRLGAEVVSSDVVRKELAGLPLGEHRYEEYERGIYSPEFTARTYGEMLSRSRRALEAGRSVVADATFRRREYRRSFSLLAEELGAEFWAVETRCPEEVVRSRLERRPGEETVSDALWETYLAQRGEFEPLDELPLSQHIIVDNSLPPDRIASEVVSRLEG